MKIHEYQSRDLLAEAGIPVPAGIVAETSDAAARAFKQHQHDGWDRSVVKAQVHAGGRGKGGGVKLVSSEAEAKAEARRILAEPLVTPQTGPEGVKVERLLVTAAVEIAKEYYVAMAVDRIRRMPVLIASAEGGMEIEEVARDKPEAIIREPIDPTGGMEPYQARKIAYKLGFTGQAVRSAAKIMQRLSEMFLERDASLVEINPLVLTGRNERHPEGEVLALDAKMVFDDNALFRQEEIKRLESPEEEEPAERRARQFGLSYIKLDGDIGCLVNGAGLAMATMDLVKLHGAEPANFLDVGGSASEEAVTEAFRIILDDANVRGVLVNIFGGIAKCDTIARAIVSAAQTVGFNVPLVVRLEGTNVEPAREIIESARASIPTMQTGQDLTDAARKIVAAVGAPA